MADDRVTRLNRRALRAHASKKRRDERHELQHACAIQRLAGAAGVLHEVQVPILFFHDVHRVLGEPSCPRCPRCLKLRAAGRIDRAPHDRQGTLKEWQALLEREREKACNGR